MKDNCEIDNYILCVSVYVTLHLYYFPLKMSDAQNALPLGRFNADVIAGRE